MMNFCYTAVRRDLLGVPVAWLTTLAAMFVVTGAAQGVSLKPDHLLAPTHGLIDLGAGAGVTAGTNYLTGSAFGTIIGLVSFGDGSPANSTGYQNLDGGDIGVNVDSEGYLTGYAINKSVGLIQFDWPGAGPTDRPRVDLATGRLSGLVFSKKMGLLDLEFIDANINLTGNGQDISDGDNSPSQADHTDFGGTLTSSGNVVRSFTIENTGSAGLYLTGNPKVSVDGEHASDFNVTLQPPSAVVAAGASSAFEVTFVPGADGVRNATLSILSTDPNENPYDVAIRGYGIGTTLDLDNDGMNDLGEYELAALGFDWENGGAVQEALVNNFIASADHYQLYNQSQYEANGSNNYAAGQSEVLADPNAFELYDLAQVQALHVRIPLLERDATTGKFALRIGLSKSSDLTAWEPFPFIASNTVVNGQGEVEFGFTGSDTAVFYRLVSAAGLPGFAMIPGGPYQRGGIVDGDADAPVQTIDVAKFYMGNTEVSKAQWDLVRAWGIINGYLDLPAGAGVAADHPVQMLNWYDVVKWCNAASEKEGLTPVYYEDGAQTTVYRTGVVDLGNANVNWGAEGYRLPTEAEWEKAARGGVSGKRYPWGTDTISHTQANYMGSGTGYGNLSIGSHPTYNDGTAPYTNPVGDFGANGYGLKNISGNVFEWCWDWYGSYVEEGDPRGPDTGDRRVLRGGSWNFDQASLRCAGRERFLPSFSGNYNGFRLARGGL